MPRPLSPREVSDQKYHAARRFKLTMPRLLQLREFSDQGFRAAAPVNLTTPMSIPRSKRRSSTFRRGNGNRTYIITTNRITSGDELQ